MTEHALKPAILASIRNGDRLTEDAQLMLDWERFPSAHALAILAQEEYSKALLLSLVVAGALPWSDDVRRALRDHICKHLASTILDYLCPEVDEFIRRYCSPGAAHKSWQLPNDVVDAVHVIVHERIPRERRRWWMSGDDTPLDAGIKAVAAGQLDQQKQNALYVDVDAAGQVRSDPHEIGRDDARREIDRANRIGADLRPYDGEPGPRRGIETEKLILLFKLLTKAITPEEFRARW